MKDERNGRREGGKTNGRKEGRKEQKNKRKKKTEGYLNIKSFFAISNVPGFN